MKQKRASLKEKNTNKLNENPIPFAGGGVAWGGKQGQSGGKDKNVKKESAPGRETKSQNSNSKS